MAKRASLNSFAPTLGADAGRVDAMPTVPPVTSETNSKAARKTYPHVSVYLPPDVIKTIKLLSLEGEGRISDICARAVVEWLEGRGLLRAEMLEGHKLQATPYKV